VDVSEIKTLFALSAVAALLVRIALVAALEQLTLFAPSALFAVLANFAGVDVVEQ